MTNYRYPTEQPIFGFTLLVILGVLAFTGVTTVCLVPIFFLIFLALMYASSQSQQRELMRRATAVTPERTPRLSALVQTCMNRLRPGAAQFFVMPSRQLNAYTFGLSSPNAVVLYSALFDVMDDDELTFVMGHELGHVGLGHSWLNTLLGGIAGVPTGIGGAVILTLAFRWWSRACEYSADRAGLIACRSLDKATSALVQLAVGDINTQQELQRALNAVKEHEAGLSNSLGEVLSSHPGIARRVEELRKYAASTEYQRLVGTTR